MSTIKTKGFVTRCTTQGDSDRYITLLSEDLGRITVSAKGAKRSGSHLAAGTQPFVYGEFVLFRGKQMYSLNSVEVQISFFELASDITIFTHAVHMADLAADSVTSPDGAKDIVHLLLLAFKALAKQTAQSDLITASFTLRLLQMEGTAPLVTKCAVCGTTKIDVITFGFTEHGFLCESCAETRQDTTIVSIGTTKAMLHVMCAPEKDVFRFALDAENEREFSTLVQQYSRRVGAKEKQKLDFLGRLSP